MHALLKLHRGEKGVNLALGATFGTRFISQFCMEPYEEKKLLFPTKENQFKKKIGSLFLSQITRVI